MPFSKQNIKFTVLTIGFVLMVLFGVMGVVAISYSPSRGSTPLYTAVTGFITILAGQLLALIRIEQAHERINETAGAIANDLGGVKHSADVAASVAVQVKRDLKQQQQVGANAHVTDNECEFTPIQLRMIEEIVRRACDRSSGPLTGNSSGEAK